MSKGCPQYSYFKDREWSEITERSREDRDKAARAFEKSDIQDIEIPYKNIQCKKINHFPQPKIPFFFNSDNEEVWLRESVSCEKEKKNFMLYFSQSPRQGLINELEKLGFYWWNLNEKKFPIGLWHKHNADGVLRYLIVRKLKEFYGG